MSQFDISIVIPAKNESDGLKMLLPELLVEYPNAEIIVVNDGSDDDTSEVIQSFGIKEIKHPYSKGNGASIKAGVLSAKGKQVVFMDGDGQHQAKDVGRLLDKLASGYDMVVGARSTIEHQANIFRGLANKIYNRIASYMVGQTIDDLTSGMRAVNKKKFIQFLSLLPNGFSYPTTSTMAFYRSGYTVGFEKIDVKKRVGKSHINVFKDGVRFFLIIFKIATLYSPLKLFFPFSVIVFVLGLVRYIYTYVQFNAFTNMSAILFMSSLLIFLIGLVSEQVSMLTYKDVSLEQKNLDADE
ncbi:glycosyltransferase family 2 protein [Pseudomaricurvus alcaniphilus]|uniref:glycosyltransferase family 2 protein n=1 Tax=Pseudomaricurvus alcaniphilus TaxID=1166482 RepID=UPI00140DA6EE|nr:glycosyltransferase family 2 protein [Pseudomaricurvus alcaniphilus]NHN38102.1 glycosyltransferase family 2 protein [Pseudomaricurvus alcaniphilus]